MPLIFKGLFHAWEGMGDEIYKQHDFSSYMYSCVDVVGHFLMNLVTMIHHNKCTYLQIVQLFHFCSLHT
jgi:hypothetical protein